MTTIETIEHHGLTIKVHPDEDPQDPREWSNLGVMSAFHPRYELGDKVTSPHPSDYPGEEEFLAAIREEHDATVILPLYLLDHSGLTMSAGPPVEVAQVDRNGAFVADPDGWDTSHVGFIFDSHETHEAWGFTNDTEQIREILESEVATYATYLEGGVVGYTIEDENGDLLDSCWGYYSIEEALADARTSAEHIAEARKLSEAQRQVSARAIGRLSEAREMLQEAGLDPLAAHVESAREKISNRLTR